MSATLSLYIARRWATMLLGAFAVTFALIALVNLVEMLRRGGDGDAAIGALFMMALLQTPAVALVALPFVVMMATLATFARMARASEIVVTRAAGVTVWALTAPPALLAAALGVASFALLNPLAAATSTRFETLHARHFEGQSSRLSVSREGLWLRQGAGDGQTVLHARGANGAATVLYDVTAHRFDDAERLVGRIDAARATLGAGVWRLSDGVARRVAADGAGALRAEPFTEMDLPTELTSAQILDSFAPPEQIPFWSLPAFIRTLEAAGFSADRHRTHWHAQLSAPVLFAAMSLIGAAFSMRHVRLGGLGLLALAAVGSAFALHFLTDVAKALGASGAIPVPLAAWGPAAAAALFAAGLLLQLEDG